MRFKEFKEAFDDEDGGNGSGISSTLKLLSGGGDLKSLLKKYPGLKNFLGPDQPDQPDHPSQAGKPITNPSGKPSPNAGKPAPSTGSRPTSTQAIAPLGKPSEELITFIKQKETFSPKAQRDYKQYSNGYGTKARSRNEVIDEREADRRLRQKVQEFYNIVVQFDSAHNYGFNQNQLNALTSFVYNGGPGWLNQVSDNGRRNKQQITQSMLTFNTAGGRTLGGLVQRRREEVAMFNAGNNKMPSSNIA